jgi:hypothetical protein
MKLKLKARSTARVPRRSSTLLRNFLGTGPLRKANDELE